MGRCGSLKMKFSIQNLDLIPSQQYPYTYRIQFDKCELAERELLLDWISDNSVPCCFLNISKPVLYLTEGNLTHFILKWS